MGMETYLKKFGEPTKCSSNDCRTMVALFFIGYARGRMDRPKDKRVC